MLTKKILFILSILILHSGCQSKKEIQSATPKSIFKVNVEEGKLFNWNEKAVVEEVIPLETTKNSLLRSIDKLRKSNNKFFLLDSRSFQLLEFYDNGKFSQKIGSPGRGPGEYKEIRDFDINGNYIYTLDYKRIHRFDKYNGQFVDSRNLKIDQKTALNPTNFMFLRIMTFIYGGAILTQMILEIISDCFF